MMIKEICIRDDYNNYLCDNIIYKKHGQNNFG